MKSNNGYQQLPEDFQDSEIAEEGPGVKAPDLKNISMNLLKNFPDIMNL